MAAHRKQINSPVSGISEKQKIDRHFIDFLTPSLPLVQLKGGSYVATERLNAIVSCWYGSIS